MLDSIRNSSRSPITDWLICLDDHLKSRQSDHLDQPRYRISKLIHSKKKRVIFIFKFKLLQNK